MWKSLLAKLGMLGAGLAVVGWVGWGVEESPVVVREPVVPPPAAVETTKPPAVVRTPAARGEPPAATRRPAPVPAQSGKIDLNTATREELETLPGVGPVLAQRMIERRKLGRFHTVDDLMDVKGIGRKRLEQLRSRVMVSAPQAPHAPSAKQKSSGT